MSWLQLHLPVPRAEVAVIEDRLRATGALAVTLADAADHPILEPGVGETPLWDHVVVSGLFAANTDSQRVLAQLRAHHRDGLRSARWEVLADQDWERSWMAHFEPLRCGQRLWVCPSWREPPDADAINLILDPGLAFGSGTHPTTFLCLQWLDGEPLAGRTVIDYGCGSGILGIAALLLGADRVIAVDNDPQALVATADNARRNRLGADRLLPCTPDLLPAVDADLVLANILAQPLIALAPAFAGALHAGGRLCLAGIIAGQEVAVTDAYRRDFRFDAPAADGPWLRLSATRVPGAP